MSMSAFEHPHASQGAAAPVSRCPKRPKPNRRAPQPRRLPVAIRTEVRNRDTGNPLTSYLQSIHGHRIHRR